MYRRQSSHTQLPENPVNAHTYSSKQLSRLSPLLPALFLLFRERAPLS